MSLQKKIWLSPPHMGGSESKFVQQAFESNWIAPLGPNVDKFENDIEKYLGIKNAAVLSSGTAALHLALIILGVGFGDEVLCQSFTFSGSANPIKYVGAVPIFIDSEADTWNMCPRLLEEAIIDRLKKGRKPKAIIPVHLYGMPAKMDEILDISNRYEIPLLEDAAEALGSRVDKRMCGTFGDISILSFNGNKIITTSGGGALISSKKEVVEKARFLATQSRDPAPHYQHSEVGYNYRMSNVLAGIGRGQMIVLDDRIKARRRIFEYYMANLGSIKGLSFLNEPSGFYSNRWLTTILIEPEITKGINRENLRQALDEENIESRPLWKPMHMQPVFKDCNAYTGGCSESLFEKGLCLPSGSNLEENDLNRICSVIHQLFNKS